MQFIKDESCYNGNDLNLSKFHHGKFHIIWISVNMMHIHSDVNRALRIFRLKILVFWPLH